MVQVPPGGDCPFTVAMKLRLHTAVSSTVPIARKRCDATVVLSATVFSSPRADAYRATIAVDTLSFTPTHRSKNLAVYRGRRNSVSSRYALPA
jgi:hypothetical protein